VNGAVIATIADMVTAGAQAVIYQRLGELPHFNPDIDCDPLPEPVADLRETLQRTDAVLLSTPEYAGSMPGSFKNLLDWTVGSGGLYGLPVGWINPSARNPQRLPTAFASAIGGGENATGRSDRASVILPGQSVVAARIGPP
jgi:NAD(P)H-dependent FMN reductase